MKNIQMQIVPIETTYDDIVLKGELEYWAKDYEVRLKEPLIGKWGAHLQYAVPVKYVLKKSSNPTCHEIELLEKAKEILKDIYLKQLVSSGKE